MTFEAEALHHPEHAAEGAPAPVAASPRRQLPVAREAFQVSDPMKEAVRSELRRALDGEISAKSLGLLIKLATAARSLLRAPRPGGRSRRMGGVIHPMYASEGMDEFLDEEEGQDPGDGAMAAQMMPYGGSLAPSPYPETFGAATIREMISALPKLTQKPDPLPALLEALRMAEEDKMGDVAEAVRAKIKERLTTAAAAEGTGVVGDFGKRPAIDVETEAPGQNGG